MSLIASLKKDISCMTYYGNIVVICCHDGTVTFLGTTICKTESYKVHSKPITCVLLLEDATLLFGSSDGHLILCDIATMSIIKTIKIDQQKCFRCILHLYNNIISVGCNDGTVLYVNLQNETNRKIVIIPEDDKDMDINHMVKLSITEIAIASADGIIRIWNTASEKCVFELKGHDAAVTQLLLLPDKSLLSASEDGDLKIWNISSKKLSMKIEGHGNAIWGLINLCDGRIATSSYDNTIKIWDMTNKTCMTLESEKQDNITSIRQLQNGSIITCNSNGNVLCYVL